MAYNNACAAAFWHEMRIGGEALLLLLLCLHVGPDNEPLDGEVENQWSNCGIKHSTGQELVGQVDREKICLAGSVKSANRKSDST